MKRIFTVVFLLLTGFFFMGCQESADTAPRVLSVSILDHAGNAFENVPVGAAVGGRLQFEVYVSAVHGAPRFVEWSVSGGNGSSRIEFGELIVGASESRDTILTVTAASTFDRSQYDSIEVKLQHNGTFGITIGSMQNGNIIVRGGYTSAAPNTTVFLIVSADLGYTLDTLTVTQQGGGNVAVSGTGGLRTFTMPSGAVTVNATFTRLPYFNITVNNPFPNGFLSPDRTSTFPGDTVTLTAAPYGTSVTGTITVRTTPGNVLIPVSGGNNIFRFTMPHSDVSINASFMVLIWYDEFEGNTLNPANWNIEQGIGIQYGISGWGNSELQWYRPDNVWVENGMLVIEAQDMRPGTFGSPSRSFTSARITTGQIKAHNLPNNSTDFSAGPERFFVRTGRVEARIRPTRGVGFWPAFWLLGANSYGPIPARGIDSRLGWPMTGEIDILEFLGGREDRLIQAIHYGPSNANRSYVVAHTTLPDNASFADDFHVFGAIWDEVGVTFTLNGYTTRFFAYADLPQRPGGLTFDERWYLRNFFNDAGFSIILNIAVGGNLGGGTPSPAAFDGVGNRMLVDWVRVFAYE